MSSNKHVLLLTSSYLPKVGGVENSIKHLAEEFRKAGYEPIIVTSDIADRKVIDERRSSTYNIKCYKSDNFLFGYLDSFFLIKKVIKTYNPDVVFSRSHMLTLSGRIAGAKDIGYIVPGVVKYQLNKDNSNWVDWKGRLKYRFNCIVQKYSFLLSKKIYVFSESMKNQVNSVVDIDSKIKKVNPGACERRFKLLSYKEKLKNKKCLGYGEETVLLLGVGRLVKAKGFNYVIESLSNLPKKFKLIIVGDGPEKDSLVNFSESLGLSERVHFVGETLEPERYYRAADLFLFASCYEPFGQVLLEATYSGLPIVAFRSSSVINTATSEIYSKNSKLVTYADKVESKSLSRAIVKAADKGSIKEQEIIDFKKKFSWEELTRNLLIESK